MQNRIQQLEELVVDLMQQTTRDRSASEPESTVWSSSSPTLTTNHTTAATPKEDASDKVSSISVNGSMQRTDTGMSYVSGAHWLAILDEITEIKDHLDDEEAQESHQAPEPTYPKFSGPQLLYGCPNLATKEEILASMPERPLIDRFVSCYFNSFEMSPGQFYHPRKLILG